MHGFDLIATLAGGLSAALVLGYITQRLGLSPIVGYLMAGVIVGPHTPGFVADAALAEQLAEIGVILLMFGVGLQFHFDELLAVRGVAVPGAVAQSAVATVLGVMVARAFGWSGPASFVFGMALAVASTVVLVRVLSDNRALHTPTGHIAVGWLVVEDLFTVVALVLLPAFFKTDMPSGGLASALVVTALKVGALVALIAFLGDRTIRRVLDLAAATHSRELFTLTVLVVALGIAVGSSLLFGVSMALGAFLAGLVVGRSEYSLRAASEALPMRDAFAVLFFVSVGMLLDPGYLLEAPGIILATLAVVMIGKPLVALVVVLLLRYPVRVAIAVSAALSQIGEFSFILVSLGQQLGVVDQTVMNVIVAVAIISIVVNPLLYRAVGPIATWAERWPALARIGAVAPAAGGSGDTQARAARAARGAIHAVIIGYGPTGQTLARLLRSNSIEPTVVELNMETIRRLRAEGVPAVYGDASRPETLEAAGVPTATGLLLTADLPNSQEVIRVARDLNRNIQVLARTSTLRDVAALKAAGADQVFSGEGEVALALVESVLHRLGATPDQIARERERAHQELQK